MFSVSDLSFGFPIFVGPVGCSSTFSGKSSLSGFVEEPGVVGSSWVRFDLSSIWEMSFFSSPVSKLLFCVSDFSICFVISRISVVFCSGSIPFGETSVTAFLSGASDKHSLSSGIAFSFPAPSSFFLCSRFFSTFCGISRFSLPFSPLSPARVA